MQAADFEIEEHVAETNNFFKRTGFTLDDLDTYADPFGSVINAVYRASEGLGTNEEAASATSQAISDLKALHAAMDLENAA